MHAILLLAYMGLIFVASLIPETQTTRHAFGSLDETIQNLLHIPAFGLLTLLWIMSLRAHGLSAPLSLFLAAVFTAGCSAASEFVQWWVPGRSASVADLLLDVTGIVVAIIAYRYVTFPACAPSVRRFFYD